MTEKEARLSKKWHGHVTAVTVNVDYRRLGLATKLMDILELVTDKQYAIIAKASFSKFLKL
jgi:N-terminal acetyltransferase B complex catalytic subunit